MLTWRLSEGRNLVAMALVLTSVTRWIGGSLSLCTPFMFFFARSCNGQARKREKKERNKKKKVKEKEKKEQKSV